MQFSQNMDKMCVDKTKFGEIGICFLSQKRNERAKERVCVWDDTGTWCDTTGVSKSQIPKLINLIHYIYTLVSDILT